MLEKKQLVLVVEGTVALGPHWQTIVSDYLQKVIRKFCGNEAMEASNSVVELALVQFDAHGSSNSCLVQRSSWARNVDCFLEWLSCMHFSGSLCDAAIAEGLAEVLMMCPPNWTKTQRHCILVAASNPYPLPTVYWPTIKGDMQSGSCLSDAEKVAKSFTQSCVSLSVICPKQLPKLKAIYNAGKRNPSTTVPTIDVKNPDYLILISEDFMEACAALSSSIITDSPPSQNSSSMEACAPRMTMQSVGVSNNRRTNVGLSQQASSALKPGKPKYVKIWEGELFGKRRGQSVVITRLEAYRHPSSVELLAEDWPSRLLIDRLVAQEVISSKLRGKHDYIVFRALTQPRFLGQIQDRKLCTVVRLPSQTLLLASTDNPIRLIGLLLPEDMIVFKQPSQHNTVTGLGQEQVRVQEAQSN